MIKTQTGSVAYVPLADLVSYEPGKAIKGIGYATAKKIIELRMSLPGERFKNLDQLRKVGRVDWDQIIAEDLIYIG